VVDQKRRSWSILTSAQAWVRIPKITNYVFEVEFYFFYFFFFKIKKKLLLDPESSFKFSFYKKKYSLPSTEKNHKKTPLNLFIHVHDTAIFLHPHEFSSCVILSPKKSSGLPVILSNIFLSITKKPLIF